MNNINNNIISTLDKIIKNKNKLSEFLLLKNIDEIYNFLYTENNSISQEEFGDFLLIVLDNLLKQENINILDDSEIDTISGGTNKFFSKTMAVILGTLSMYTGNISNQNIQAISNTKTSNSMSISEVQDKIGNLSKEEIEKIQKDLKKEIKKHGLEKYLKIHKSKDKNWQYVFNKDGENTITLLKCLSEKATTLDSTIDGYKITRVSDSFGHIKDQFLLKETLKPYLFAGALACTIILIPFIGFMYDSGDPFGKKYESIFSNIKSVNLEYCTHISNNSFKNCANLEQVNLPMCEEIGESAFYDCTSLNKINLPNCKIIKYSAFRNCINLTNVELPMCQEIDSATFYNCTNLNKINLPNCKIIKEFAFRDCTNLTDIESPMCQEIGIFTFYSCTKLNNINLPNCKNVEESSFESCTNLEHVNLPICEKIGKCAFQNCTNFTNIELPMCQEIDESAFSNCTKLNKINLPNCKSIDNTAFNHCVNLDSKSKENIIKIVSNSWF